MSKLPDSIDGLPNISGAEEQVAAATADKGPVYLQASGIDFGRIKSAFAIALHMHQPLILGETGDLRTAPVISNLQYMMENPQIGDNHNASIFRWCYKRMGEFIPQLAQEGKLPRVMLDYSGCLLYGLRQMGADDVISALQHITCDSTFRRSVEWLGTAWGHAVAPARRCRISACTCGPGSTTLPHSLASTRCRALRDFPRRRWPCPTIRMLPMNLSGRSKTAASAGSWCRSIPWSGWKMAAACRFGIYHTVW